MHQSRQQVLCHPTIDPGCGAGNSTEVLIQRFPNATVAGVDLFCKDDLSFKRSDHYFLLEMPSYPVDIGRQLVRRSFRKGAFQIIEKGGYTRAQQPSRGI